MSCCGSSDVAINEGCCTNKLVRPRCKDITIIQVVLGDESGNALIDDFGTAISLGILRIGANVEFEFNRQTTS